MKHSAVVLALLLLGRSAPVWAFNDLLNGIFNEHGKQPDFHVETLSQADDNAVNKWIGERVAGHQQPFCYKQTKTRGVGVPLSTCDAGQELNGLLCYPNCKSEYGGAGPVCWHNCPSDYTDTGAFCHISKDLTKDVSTSCSGTWPWEWSCTQSCPSGYTNAGIFCALNTPSTPSGWSGDGLDLIKDSYGRGAGYPMKCTASQEEQAGLCYTKCDTSYYGVGPVCWQSCPSGQIDCGAGCSASKTGCGAAVANMVVSPLIMVASVASLVTTAGASAAATAEADDAAKGTVDALELVHGTQDAADAEKAAGTLDKLATSISDSWSDFTNWVKSADFKTWAASKANNFAKNKNIQYEALKAGDLYKAVTTGSKASVAMKFGAKGLKVGLMIDHWVKNATGNFSQLTTPEVTAQLDKSFSGHPKAEQWVKEQYALVNLSQLANQNAQQTANTVLSVAGLADPTGVTGVVAAYDNPMCAINDPFPSFTINYNSPPM